MTSVIINADDLGINQFVNKSIEEFIKSNIISSATILSVGLAIEDAIGIAKENPNITYGIHLCLDEFSALTHSEELLNHGIVDEFNKFTKDGIYKIRKPTTVLKNALYDELLAQIQFVLSYGIPISHIDSHHHFHTKKIWILDIISQVAKLSNINKIRLPMSNLLTIRKSKRLYADVLPQKSVATSSLSTSKSKLFRAFGLLEKMIYEKIWTYKAKKTFITADAFYSYTVLNDSFTALQPYIKDKTVELMCHPGHIKYDYESELIKQMALDDKLNYRLINYNQI
jgi:predicted glycoside hydrolase/deacetylase ChbG (UPF0249 family)